MISEGRSDLSLMEEETEEASWLMTYADLMTLLLVFFILLFSISNLNMERFKAAIASIQVSLGKTVPATGLLDLIGSDGVLDKPARLEEIIGIRSRQQDVMAEIESLVRQRQIQDHIEVFLRDGNIVIHIRGAVLFGSGQAMLAAEGRPVLAEISRIVEKFSGYNINIKGHTDDRPISTPRFPSNWELSAIRATTVLKFMIGQGIDPGRMTATGYGDLMPVASNETPEGRARNRRVEFVLQDQKAGD